MRGVGETTGIKSIDTGSDRVGQYHEIPATIV